MRLRRCSTKRERLPGEMEGAAGFPRRLLGRSDRHSTTSLSTQSKVRVTAFFQFR